MRFLIQLLLIGCILLPPGLLLAHDNHSDRPALELYKPNYVTIDQKKADIKFQLSYRVKLAEYGRAWGVFFSHTHKAYWAITSEESAPFREHNFNPEVHIRWKNPESGLPLKHVQLGVEHESSGVSGPASRSWNRVTGQTEWTINSKDPSIKGYLKLYLRGWLILDRDEENNPDIEDHLGYGEVGISYTIHEELKLGGQVALTFRQKSIMAEYGFKSKKSEYFYYLQYWNGRGEWLVDYKKDTNVLRAGIKFFVDD